MSDLQKILSILGTLKDDVSDLKTGQELIKLEQVGIKEELRDLKIGQELIKEELWTMKAAAAHNFDSLSKQFIGVLQDFGNLGVKMNESFEKWTKQADSRVVDKVMDIQGPRIRALEVRFQEVING
jgi:hypothetical protein